MLIRKTGLSILWCVICCFVMNLPVYAQPASTRYTNARDLTLIGKIFPDELGYHRVDTAVYSTLPPAVKRLLTHSAGLAIRFSTNSTYIAAKWCVTPTRQYTNMTPIVNKGLDLYIKRNGKWQAAAVGRPDSLCSSSTLIRNMDSSVKECLLYMPLYDELKHLEIGVSPEAAIQPSEDPFKHRVIVYGSSIVHGASAARPGLAYPSKLSRETGWHFLNMGMSGSAKMEKAVADMLAGAEADAFVLDCVPNTSPEDIEARTAYLVNTIRAAHPGKPVIVVGTVLRQTGFFDRVVGERVRRQNEQIREEFNKLIAEGVQDIYFIAGEDLLGHDHEGTTDGLHPNDLGFERMVQILKPELTKILMRYSPFNGK